MHEWENKWRGRSNKEASALQKPIINERINKSAAIQLTKKKPTNSMAEEKGNFDAGHNKFQPGIPAIIIECQWIIMSNATTNRIACFHKIVFFVFLFTLLVFLLFFADVEMQQAMHHGGAYLYLSSRKFILNSFQFRKKNKKNTKNY